MNMHIVTSGSTGLARIRSLLAFRHQNPFARLVSTVVAFTVAMLLVVGSGTAFADDTAPDETVTTEPMTEPAPVEEIVEEPAKEPAEESVEEPVEESVEEPKGPAEESSEEGSGAPTLLAKSQPSISGALEELALADVVALAVPCLAGTTPLVGGFQIDADTCVEGGTDWDNTGLSVQDGFGDGSWFTGGSTKDNEDPSNWLTGGSVQTKTDIDTAYAYSQVVGSTVYAYFGFSRHPKALPGANGTVNYDVEYNQLGNTGSGQASRPQRSPGDLLLQVEQGGGTSLALEGVYKYTLGTPGGSCFAVNDSSPAASWCPMTPGSALTSRISPAGDFAEGALDLTALFGPGNCSGTFGVVNIRSRVSGSTTAVLADFVAPLNATTPSTCGKIIINKVDENGSPLGGATFTVSPNPDPTKADNVAYSITDNDAKDKNPANGVIEISPVDPTAPGNVYTVTETGAPTGYMIDNPLGTSTNPQTVGSSQTKTFNFTDHRIWQGVTATKDATPRYTAEYDWSIVKEISPDGTDGSWVTDTTGAAPLVKEVASDAADADTLYYRVNVTEGARTPSDYVVDGSVYVTNPDDNVGAMTVDLTDSVPGDASCTFPGGASVSVPADGVAHAYAYTCDLGDTPAPGDIAGLQTNTATVTWDRSDYPQVPGDLTNVGGPTRHVDATADYNFASAVVTEVNKTVTVTDNQHTFDPAWTITWNSANGTSNTSGVYTQTLVVDPGSCSSVFANTATITGNGVAGVGGDDEILGSDSEYGKVCEGADLTITRLDAETLVRTYPWSIEKSTTTPKVIADEQGNATADYTVIVTAGDGVDSAWSISGTITVHNPNDWQAVDVTSLPVSYTGGGTCHVDGETFPVSVPASGSHPFAYSCDIVAQPDYDGTINATVNWGASANTPTTQATDGLAITEADWDKTLVNDTVTVVDDNATPGDTSDDTEWPLTWSDVYDEEDPDHQTMLTYSIDLEVPDGGTCADETNTVKILGDGDTELDADQDQENNSAVVKVCNPLGLSVTKDATGDFTRTYNWSIEKFINGDQTSQEVHVDSYAHTFDYKVVVTPGEAVDSDWVVSGTITVTNDNVSEDIDPIQLTDVTDLPDVGADAACTYTPPGTFPIAIDSGDHVDVGYECTFEDQPTKPYGGTNSATATWGQTGTDTSEAVPVDWNDPTEVDKSIDVFDDKVDLDPAELLGTVDWNDAGTPEDFTYSTEHTVSKDVAGRCGPDFVNTAWLGGTADGEPTERQDSTIARICPNPGTWTVAKTSDVGDGAVPTDSDITYTLTAHKTGGVNPEDVVLTDDLSDMVPYIDTFVPPAAPAGTTVDYDAATHVLTWTIDELGAEDQTLEFTVHVKADAYGVDLPNLVTSPGSTNCPTEEDAGPACETDNDTPHYTLEKSSDAGAEVLPPYLGDPGTLITYTLTVHNDSDAPINPTTLPGATVTDDLSLVLDDAAFVPGSIDPSDQAELDGSILTWTLPEIPVDGTVTLTYQVRVDGDQWDETLTNDAAPGDGGDCIEEGACTTTTVTPPYTQIQALKVDFETGEPLAGAEFSLFDGETEIDTAVSDESGIAFFDVKLQPGEFTVQETKAPDGYDLPINGLDTVTVIIDEPDAPESNFVENGVMVPIEFEDPALGQLALMPKAQFERDPLSLLWVPSDGVVEFGDEIRYVVPVESEGEKIFHDVTLTDYVPGWNPDDVTTSPAGTKADLVVDSITCGGGITCTSEVDLATGLITWHLTETGEAEGQFVGDASGWVEFVVRMPDIPGTSPIQTPGTAFAAALWNQAYLDWRQLDFVADEERPDALRPEMTDHELASNEVVVTASATLPPEVIPPAGPKPTPTQGALPATGGPDQWLLLGGFVLLLGGGTLVAGDRRRKHRS